MSIANIYLIHSYVYHNSALSSVSLDYTDQFFWSNKVAASTKNPFCLIKNSITIRIYVMKTIIKDIN